MNTIPRTVQSANIPIHTAIGPKPYTRHKNIVKLTRHNHMLAHDVIIENFTSPAARIPYAGMNDNTYDIGLVIVMKRVISKHILALSASIPPSMVIGRHNANTTRQLIIMAASAILLSFFI